MDINKSIVHLGRRCACCNPIKYYTEATSILRRGFKDDTATPHENQLEHSSHLQSSHSKYRLEVQSSWVLKEMERTWGWKLLQESWTEISGYYLAVFFFNGKQKGIQ